jgi:hypothetical protein
MPKTIEITVYQFNELPEKAKEKARENYITNWMSDDWYEFTYDMMKEEGLKYGFNIKDIRFSGFWSQGDGASWCGAVNVREWIKSKPTAYQEHATTQIILALIEEGWVDEQVLVSFGTGHYCHEYNMSITDINAHEPDNYDETIERGMFKGASVKELVHIIGCAGGALYDMSKELEEDCKAFARTIYRELEADYDASVEDENIAANYAANDVWFDESGRMA